MPKPVEINVGFMAHDLKLSPETVRKVIDLLDAGYPVPFIARYRKDETDNLKEEQLWDLVALFEEQKKLIQRKQTILRSIESLGLLSPELEQKILEARTNRRLEDIYLPYKPQKQTLASIAKDQGLEPLANEFLAAVEETAPPLQQRAAEFINPEKNLVTVDDVLHGVGYIISEKYANHLELRQRIRDLIRRQGRIVTSFTKKKTTESCETSENNSETGASAEYKNNTNVAGVTDVVESKEVAENTVITDAVNTTEDVNTTEFVATAITAAEENELSPENIENSESVENNENNSDESATCPVVASAESISAEPLDSEQSSETFSSDAVSVADAVSESSADSASENTLEVISEDKSEVSSEVVESRKARKKQEKLERQQKEQEHLQNLYKDYADFSMEIRTCPPHRILAINRAEKSNVLRVRMDLPKDKISETAQSFIFNGSNHPYQEFLINCLQDSLTRLLVPSLEREIRNELQDRAEEQSIEVFAKNLRNLLLQKPLSRRRVLAIDPGFTHGCKLAALDEFGNVLAHDTIYIKGNGERRKKTAAKLAELINNYNLSIIAIGNGTGCRESEQFVTQLLSDYFTGKDVAYIIVNESGASVYSVSSLAREEFPSYNSLTCGAISIGRRLQDALNELVKIDPGSLGVGMYQHDLKDKALKSALTRTVESCVNQVGVDLNAATPAILRYVSGLNQLTAKRIYEYRVANGPYRQRTQLKEVSGFGEAAFVHSAGFLKISDGYEPLDSTWIHPESYELARKILAKIGFEPEDLKISTKSAELAEKIKELDPVALKEEFQAGLHTITDILEQIVRPGRDPRTELPSPIFKKGTLKIEDLQPGMEMTGTVLNVVDFGAFVDIGLHQSGLVHISHLGDRFVKDAHTRVAVGDIVKVWVLDVDQQRHRISLTMIEPGHERPKRNENVPSSEENRSGNASGRRPRANNKDYSRDNNRENSTGNNRDSNNRENQEGRSSRDYRGGRSRTGGERKVSSETDSRISRGDNNRGEKKYGERAEYQERRSVTSRNKPTARPVSAPPKSKPPIIPISEEMKKGKEPLRSFSDLAQLFGRLNPDDSANQNKKKENIEKKSESTEGENNG